MANLLSTIITGGSGTTPTLSLSRNIATPSNYYNGLQLEVKATSGTAGIALHRNGYSHVGIYHDSANELKFNMNSGTPILTGTAGTIWGSGNDGAGSGLDADLIDGIDSSRIVYGDGARASTYVSSMNDPNQKSGFFFKDSPTGQPFADWWNWMTVAGNSWQSSNNYSFQIAHAFHSDDAYIRRMTNGEAYGWRTLITSGNIGSQSVTYATSSTRLYASDSPYTYGNTNPYYLYMNYDGGSYWELKVSPATPGTVKVAYANSAGGVAWTNVSSRPTALSQFTNDSGFITSSGSISGNAASATFARRIAGPERIGFNVGGDASTFYPIAIFTGAGSTENQYSEFIIERGGYEDPGYSGIGFSTFNARFTFKPTGWGYGANYFHLEQLTQTATMLGDYLDQYQSAQAIIWLRGATRYNIYSVYGSIDLLFANESGISYTMAYGTYDPIDTPKEKATTNKYYEGSVRYSGSIHTGSNTVIHSGNIASQSVTYATSAGTITNQANSATTTASTSPTANTIALRDASGDISAREIVLNSGLSSATPTVLVSMYPTTNQLVRTTPAAVAAALSGQSMNISGSATTAGTAGYADEAKWISYPDGPRNLSDRSPSWNNRSVAWDFVEAVHANGTGNYGGVMTFVPWDGTSGSTGDSSYQLAFGNASGVNASGQPKLSIRNGINSTWNSWYTLIHSGNISSQSVGSLQGYSASALLQQSRGTHSGSDFTSGTLVTTDIGANEWAGDSFIMEVSGKSYDGNNSPFKLIMQGYLYADTIINVSAMSYGSYFPAPVKVMNLDGNLAFWWPRGSYWNSFEVHVREAGGSGWNRVTGIDNSVDPPSATKKVSCTPIQVLHTNNAGYAYNMNQNVRTDSGPTFANVYASGWFRNYGNQGIYNESYGTHFYSNGSGDWSITGSGAGVALAFRSNHQSTIRGYVHGDTSNQIGFLNNGGGWALRTNSSNNAFIHGTDLTINADNSGSSNIFMNDGDEGMRQIHCNSNRIGFLTQGGGWGSWCHDDGWFQSDYSLRAPIFYDSNDTNYFVDPNSTSQLSYVLANNWFRPQGNTGVYFQTYGRGIWAADSAGSSYGSVSIYGSGLNDWPGWAINNLAVFMARDIRRGIFIPSADSWLIRYEQSINEAVVDFQLSWGSDIRYKSNVNTISSALEKVTSLRGVTYNYKTSEKTSIGFIAQEVEQVVPEVVSTDIEGYKSVSYANMVALLTEAIKEQQTIINDLKARIELLESK